MRGQLMFQRGGKKFNFPGKLLVKLGISVVKSNILENGDNRFGNKFELPGKLTVKVNNELHLMPCKNKLLPMW